MIKNGEKYIISLIITVILLYKKRGIKNYFYEVEKNIHFFDVYEKKWIFFETSKTLKNTKIEYINAVNE